MVSVRDLDPPGNARNNPAVIVYGLFPLLSYLLGALPFGFLLVKVLRGVDLRTVGSGNLGATNAARVLGAGWFAVVFLLDFLKGFVPAYLLARWAAHSFDAPAEIGLLYGAAAVVGHIFPVYLGFRGGKGVATAGGMVTGVAPAAAGVAALAFFAVFLPFRYVSLGSISAAVALPVAYLLLEGGPVLRATPLVLLALALLVVVKHRTNIRRLLAGTEPKARRKEPSEGVSHA
jgi:glycerol-3-phosphate acyltransferase PlsY